MNNFSFQNPTRLVFGKGQIAKLSSLVPTGSKVMLTMGGGSIFKNGIYDQVKTALEAGGHQWVEFQGIEPNPEYETLMQAVELARREGVDFLLAVGGGSVVDGTKFIATAIHYAGNDPWEILFNPKAWGRSVPLASVLTLPATGSEMNCGAVISRRERDEKFAFQNPDNFPVFSILDPEAIYSLPVRQVANGIVDTFAHTLEQYLVVEADGGRNMVMDRFCEGLMQTLVALAPELLQENRSYDACANFMLTATMGLNGFVGMGATQDWATHMIGHELTALHGLDHGVTLAIVHPAVMQVMRAEKKAKLVQYAERVWGISSGSDLEKIDAAVAATEKFYRSVGIKTRLSEHGIDKKTIDEVVGRFERRGTVLGEYGRITPDKVRRILETAL